MSKVKQKSPSMVPQHLQQCVVVDVFLPKRLSNLAVLGGLLQETLDFRKAHRYLLDHAEELFDEEYQKSEAAVEVAAETYKLGPKPKRPPTAFATFEQRLHEVERRIEGYSIFELDGAFEKVAKSSVIVTDREERFASALTLRGTEAEQHFTSCSALFADCLDGPIGEVKHPNSVGGTLHHHPDKPDDNRHRIWVNGDTRFHVEHRTAGKYVYMPCLTIMEERNLMIRFITKPNERDTLAPKEFIRSAGELPRPMKRVLWDTMILVGCFFARRLGKDNGVEDEIWITYDIDYLWIWKNGDAMLTVK